MELSKLLKEKIEKQIASWDAEIEAAETKARARQASLASRPWEVPKVSRKETGREWTVDRITSETVDTAQENN